MTIRAFNEPAGVRSVFGERHCRRPSSAAPEGTNKGRRHAADDHMGPDHAVIKGVLNRHGDSPNTVARPSRFMGRGHRLHPPRPLALGAEFCGAIAGIGNLILRGRPRHPGAPSPSSAQAGRRNGGGVRFAGVFLGEVPPLYRGEGGVEGTSARRRRLKSLYCSGPLATALRATNLQQADRGWYDKNDAADGEK